MSRLLKGLGVIAGLALVAGLVYLLVVFSRGAGAAALRADALEAERDSTKLVAGVWERRAKQFLIRATDAETALQLKPKTSVAIKLKVDTVYVDTVTGSPVVVDGEDVRSSTIDYLHQVPEEPPVSLTATMELPPAGQPGRLLNARIGIDPFTIMPRVSCSAEKVSGIHRAHVTLDSLPRWVRPEILEAQASPDVCNARGGFRISLGGGWKWTAGAGILGLLVGAVAIP